MADRRDRAPDIPDLVVPPPRKPAPAEPRHDVAITASDDDPFDMEIERTGVSTPPAVSRRPSAGAAPTVSSSGLDVAYKRSDLEQSESTDERPSVLPEVAAWASMLIGLAGAGAALVKLAHRHGGRSVTGLLPHAFDASSVIQSAVVALTSLAIAIALGYAGLKVQPRSYATLGAAGMMLLGSLAMVTVTLVATDEHPTPPDGALLVPYVVPIALLALGLSAAGRGVVLFRRGGGHRVAAPLAGAAAGGLLFAGIELSRLATWLP